MSESIGAALRQKREQRQLTLQQVSEATRIRVHSLQALENDDISAMPSAAQARGFMRIYATFLELDLEALIPPPATVMPAGAPAASTQDATPDPSPLASKADPRPAATGLLSSLRDRLVRRFGIGSPSTEAIETPQAGPQTETDAKKKALP